MAIGVDLCSLTAGASEYFEHIDADTIQRFCGKTFRVFERERLDG